MSEEKSTDDSQQSVGEDKNAEGKMHGAERLSADEAGIGSAASQGGNSRMSNVNEEGTDPRLTESVGQGQS